MKLAWFRPHALTDARPFDESAALIGDLRSVGHAIDVVTRPAAHDFVWKHFRTPYDLCVHELDNTPPYDYVWAYLLQYGGVLLLRQLTLHDGRASTLAKRGRMDDYAVEFGFNEGCAARSRTGPAGRGTWPMLRVPLMSACLAVLPHQGIANALQEQYPEARIRYAPLGASPPAASRPGNQAAGAPVSFGLLTADREHVARRAMARAVESGARAALVVDPDPLEVLQQSDVAVVLRWPSHGAPETEALTSMAAGKPVIVLESPSTADWPALDPQTWQPRGFGSDEAVAVSIDLRDEEHSLMLAVRRLSADANLRARLGEAGRAWWVARASVPVVSTAWQHLLHEAAALEPPPRPAGWPAHLDADGTGRARMLLGEFDVTVDFLERGA